MGFFLFLYAMSRIIKKPTPFGVGFKIILRNKLFGACSQQSHVACFLDGFAAHRFDLHLVNVHALLAKLAFQLAIPARVILVACEDLCVPTVEDGEPDL